MIGGRLSIITSEFTINEVQSSSYRSFVNMTEDIISQTEAAWPGILAERYVIAAGTCILIWDWCLTLESERTIIWGKNSSSIARLPYIFIRYAVMLTQAPILYAIGGSTSSLSDGFCRGWYIYLVICSIVSTSAANWVLITWLYALWDHRRWVLRVLMCALVASSISVTFFNMYSISEILKNIHFEPNILHACIFQKDPRTYAGVWASQVALDVFVGVMTLWNAADRPRSAGVRMISDLLRDGIVLWGVLFALRLMNAILCFVDNTAYTFMGVVFSWAIVTVITTRLLLRVESMKLPRGQGQNGCGSGEFELNVVPHDLDPEEQSRHEEDADNDRAHVGLHLVCTH